MAPSGTFEVQGEAAESEETLDELRLVGFSGVNKTEGGIVSLHHPALLEANAYPRSKQILATKSSAPSSTPLSLKRPASDIDTSATPVASSSGAVALPPRTSRAAKASLWAFTTAATSSGAATPTIDESTLLTDADLERPTLVKREDCDVKRTRKACKNCTCGLREILLDEKEPDDLVQAGFEAAPNVTAQSSSTKGARKMKSGVTSSCGNCYLGDAFRCGSCPYLGQSTCSSFDSHVLSLTLYRSIGMPAFEPGQKVQVSGMDDTI